MELEDSYIIWGSFMRIKAEITVCTYFAFSIFSMEQYVQEAVAHTWNT